MISKIERLRSDVIGRISSSHAYPDVSRAVEGLLMPFLRTHAVATIEVHLQYVPHTFDIHIILTDNPFKLGLNLNKDDDAVSVVLRSLAVLSSAVRITYHDGQRYIVNCVGNTTAGSLDRRRQFDPVGRETNRIMVKVVGLFRQIPVRFDEQVQSRIFIAENTARHVELICLPFCKSRIIVYHKRAADSSPNYVLYERDRGDIETTEDNVRAWFTDAVAGLVTHSLHYTSNGRDNRNVNVTIYAVVAIAMTHAAKKRCVQVLFINGSLVHASSDVFNAVRRVAHEVYSQRLQHLTPNGVNYVIMCTWQLESSKRRKKDVDQTILYSADHFDASAHTTWFLEQVQIALRRCTPKEAYGSNLIQRNNRNLYPLRMIEAPVLELNGNRDSTLQPCGMLRPDGTLCPQGPHNRIRKADLIGLHVVGQCNNSVVLCLHPITRVLYAIDQHAAAERIRLEYFLKNVRGLLTTFSVGAGGSVVELSPIVHACLIEHVQVVRDWGWDVSLVGEDSTAVTVRAVPGLRFPCDHGTPTSALQPQELISFLEDVRLCKGSFRSSLPQCILQKLISRSCRGAVMFGTSLTRSECQQLVDDLAATNHPTVCSHGRRSVVALTTLI
eukprot:PhM_4_TR10078/c0_g1_i1/m.77399